MKRLLCVVTLLAGCSKPAEPTKEPEPVNFGGKTKKAEKKPDAYERAIARFGKADVSTDSSLTWDDPQKDGGGSVTIDFIGEPGLRVFEKATVQAPEFVRAGKGGQWIMVSLPATQEQAVGLLEKWAKKRQK